MVLHTLCHVCTFSLHRESPDKILGDERVLLQGWFCHRGAAPGVNSTEWQVAGDASEAAPLQRDRGDCKWAWPGTHITIFYLSKCFSIHSNLKWSNMVIFCSKNFKKNVAM
jgi:hypothetical protein